MNRLIYITLLMILASCSKSDSNSAAGSGSGVQTGSLASFNISGNHLLLVDKNRILSYDISKPEEPIFKSEYVNQANIFETLFIMGDTVFVGSQQAMLIMQLSDDGQLQYRGSASHIRSCDPVIVSGNIAYLTTHTGAICPGDNLLNIYDVSNIFSPKLITSKSMTNPLGLALNGDYLYVCDLEDGIVVFNVSDTHNPILLNTVADDNIPKDIIILNSHEMLVLNEDRISFYDISNPSVPVFKYSYE